VDLPTGISGINGNSVSVYPNPANDVIIVSGLSGLSAEKICIINSLGQRVLNFNISKDASEMKLNVASLPEAIYILSLEENDHAVFQTRINVIH
ncbi:MAG: T9SS type A sorting domain-containing protein, partial [Chitinophagales bacterium]